MKFSVMLFARLFCLSSLTIGVLVASSNAESPSKLADLSSEERKELLLEPLYKWSQLGNFNPALESAEGYTDFTFGLKAQEEAPSPEEEKALSSLESFVKRIQRAERASVELVYNFDLFDFGVRALGRSSTGLYYHSRREIVAEPEGAGSENAAPTSEETEVIASEPEVKASSKSPVESLAEALVGETEAYFFRLNSPAAVFGYTQVRVRPQEPTGSERNFIYSPVIASLREVPSAHLGDPFLGFTLSIDDIFGLYGLPNEKDVKLLARKTLLLPFSGSILLSGESASSLVARGPQGGFASISGVYRSADGGASFNNLAVSGESYSSSSSWLPSSTVLVERSATIVSYFPSDPLYPRGQQVVIFDDLLGLPAVRLSYNLNGTLARVLFYTWGIYQHDASTKVPFLTSLSAIDPDGRLASVLSTSAIHFHFEAKSESPETKELPSWLKDARALTDVAQYESKEK